MAACIYPWTKFYYDFHAIWYSDDPYIEFIGDEEIGKMILDGTEYNVLVFHDIRDTGIYFYNQDVYDENTDTNDDLIWKGKAKVKNGQLVLTVSQDNLSNYEGKTITLNQRAIP